MAGSVEVVVAATTATGSTTVPVPQQGQGDRVDAQQQQQDPSVAPSFPSCKSRLFSWRLAGAVLAFLVVLGWVFIIVMLILEEKWQLVLVAWLLLYSAAHFCYWYCKRHSLLTIHRQIRLRVLAHSRNLENGEKSEDGPPTYDEVMKTEAPPPAYFTVVSENVKNPSGISSCVPTGAPSCSSSFTTTNTCSEKQSQETPKEKNAMRTMFRLEIRECPPAYQSPKSPRALSPRILPVTHGSGISLVTATAAASAAATATAAFSYLPPTANEEVATTTEDPIRNPIVQHLRSAAMPTIEVSSNLDVSNGGGQEEDEVTSDVHDQIHYEALDLQRSSIF